MSICRRYANDDLDARGLLNQSFLKILMNLAKRKENVPFIAWAKRITINTIISEFRKEKSRMEREERMEQHHLENHSVSWNSIAETIEAEVLQLMLDRLPEASRKVFNLFAIDGYSHQEIAEMLGISEGTSKWHVSAARKDLRAQLEKHVSTQSIPS
jgi:RNA polymerase sigma-70 factor (ECF subfamily)